MKNKLNLTSKIAISLVFAVMLFVAIASASQVTETSSDPKIDKCQKKCEQTYKKAIKTCQKKYKGDTSGSESICESQAATAKKDCEAMCGLPY